MLAVSHCLTAAGTVVAVAARGRFEVEIAAPPRCSGCAGLCAWRQPAAVQRGVFASRRAFAVGDAVVVRLPERYLLIGSLLLYGLPLAAVLTGAAAGAAAAGSDLGTVLGAVLAVAAAWVTTPRLRRRLEQRTLQGLELAAGTRSDAAAPSL